MLNYELVFVVVTMVSLFSVNNYNIERGLKLVFYVPVKGITCYEQHTAPSKS